MHWDSVFVTFVLCASAAAQQTTAQRQASLREGAKSAVDREMAREKTGDCPNVETALAEVQCLGREGKTSAANLNTFIAAIRGLIKLGWNDYPDTHPGPSGVPLTGSQVLQQFDDAQLAWDKYSRAGCDAAFGIYKGGTLAPVAEARCNQRMLRARLRELEALYGDFFSR